MATTLDLELAVQVAEADYSQTVELVIVYLCQEQPALCSAMQAEQLQTPLEGLIPVLKAMLERPLLLGLVAMGSSAVDKPVKQVSSFDLGGQTAAGTGLGQTTGNEKV